MARKPKVNTGNFYPTLMLLALAGTGVAAWFERWQYAVIALVFGMFVLSLQLGAIYNQYAGITRLIQILNGLFMAFLRSQGVELEGKLPGEEEQEVEETGI